MAARILLIKVAPAVRLRDSALCYRNFAWPTCTPLLSKRDKPGTTAAVTQRLYLNLHLDAFVHLLNVGNHPDTPPQCLQTVQCFHGQRQRVGVEAAETLIDEERFDDQLA